MFLLGRINEVKLCIDNNQLNNHMKSIPLLALVLFAVSLHSNAVNSYKY